jgi:hypothetical protein
MSTVNPITGLAAEPLTWALERIRSASQGRTLPLYGTATWAALDDRDPRRWAAVLVAAEAWRIHRAPEQIALDMRRALNEIDNLVIARLKGASLDVAEAADWTAIAGNPSHAELRRRRSA